MELSPELYYQAYVSRDPRFDGVFYIGVTSTGIYCRPVCPARTPKASNCRFYDSAEAAEKDSFRPCLRCRPELSSRQIRRNVRKEAAGDGVSAAADDTSVLQISYRPPYDWKGILSFLAKRAVKSVEWVTEESYARTVRLGQRTGWIRLTHAPEKNALMLEFTHSLTPVLPALMSRVRHLFDLNARPDVISAHLQKDSLLKDAVLRNPGLRVPGAFDGFELAARAILGQQVTVKAATTLACRLMEAYGDPIETPFAELSRLSPLPEKLAKLGVGEIARYGIVSARAKSLIALAQVCASSLLTLEPGMHPEKAVAQLDALPGIGPWTAHYIAMRALRWPDGFPKEDIAIRNNLGGVSAKEADAMSQAWRPWRSYAVLHIWNGL